MASGPGRSVRGPRTALLCAILLAGCAATGPAPSATPAPADPTAAPSATAGVQSGSLYVMPASQLDTANIAWIATDPPDPPATPQPTPTPLPATTPKAGTSIPAGAFRVPVLMYHLITTPVPSYALEGLVVSPTLFDAQMKGLKDAGWTTITAAQLAAAITSGARPPARTVVVTFDDGYADGYNNAMPILQRYGFVGTFYIITDRIGTPPFLDEGMVRLMARAGMEIANHTRQHVDLTAQSYASALAQISGANDAIQALTGVRPTTLAYPYGSVNTTAVKAAADAGITLATTTVEGCVEYPANRLSAPRIRVSPSMSASYLLRTLEPCIGG
jgi:peptidoglycan/xylan/chitin deacetylase (PgdA/CDA1 family)